MATTLIHWLVKEAEVMVKKADDKGHHNPADVTMRNIHALQKRVEKLETDVRRLLELNQVVPRTEDKLVPNDPRYNGPSETTDASEE